LTSIDEVEDLGKMSERFVKKTVLKPMEKKVVAEAKETGPVCTIEIDRDLVG
jgi:hypothetical protein